MKYNILQCAAALSSRGVKKFFSTVVKIVVAPIAIPIVVFIKTMFGCRTYHVENGFVLAVLILLNFATGNVMNLWKWIESAAVLLTFMHANISQRMEEQQREELERLGASSVDCFDKLEPIFIVKEVLWLAAFLHAGLYPALVGVGIFLMFYPWRAEWRRRYPLSN